MERDAALWGGPGGRARGDRAQGGMGRGGPGPRTGSRTGPEVTGLRGDGARGDGAGGGARAGHAGTPTATARSNTRSARERRAGRWATSTTVRPAESRAKASSTSALVRPSRLAVGSSSSSRGASRRKAWRAPPAGAPRREDPRPVLAEDGLGATREPGQQVAEAGGGRPLAAPPPGWRPGAREAGRVGQRRGEEVRTLRYPGDAAAPGVGVQAGQVDPPDPHRAGVSLKEAEQYGQQERLAGAASDPSRPGPLPAPPSG